MSEVNLSENLLDQTRKETNEIFSDLVNGRYDENDSDQIINPLKQIQNYKRIGQKTILSIIIYYREKKSLIILTQIIL